MLCKSQGINDTLTLFRWRVAAPTGQDGVTSDMRDVESATFFASTKDITLDSIYFSGGWWPWPFGDSMCMCVRCVCV